MILFIPRNKERANFVLLTQSSTSFHCSRQPTFYHFVDLPGLLSFFQGFFLAVCLRFSEAEGGCRTGRALARLSAFKQRLISLAGIAFRRIEGRRNGTRKPRQGP